MTGSAQPGITDHPTEHLLTAALPLVPTTPADCRTAVEALREIVRRKLLGDLIEIVASTPRETPSEETGELGVEDYWDPSSLTIDVGFSAAAYTALGTAAGDSDKCVGRLPVCSHDHPSARGVVPGPAPRTAWHQDD